MLSVIIPTYNEEDVLRSCLESLDKQSLKEFEVIVVDDGSTDDTLSVIGNLQFKIYNLHILKQDHKGAGAARNLGAKKSRGTILVFVDADMTFDKKFLQKLVAPIVAGKSKGTFSKYEYVSNWDSVWARCWNINQGWAPKKRHPRKYPDSQPVFRAILKSEFNKVGGFTPGGYDDDWSLFRKLGYQAKSANDAFFYHKNPGSLREIFTHAKWVGKRKYKFGLAGRIYALMRASLPVSVVIGLLKAIYKKTAAFLLFKIVYDLGVFIGILTSFGGKLAK